MIYFLYGDNDFQIDRRANELKQQFVAEYGASSIITIDVNESSPADIMRQLTSLNLFASHQLIIVKAFTSVNENWTMLEHNIEYIPDTNTVILTNTKELNKVNNLTITKTFKKLKTSGATLEKYEIIKPRDIKSWLTSELKQRGLSMNSSTQATLINLTAGDENQQARICTELDKLALLGGTITTEMVMDYVQPSLQTNAFAILDFAIKGDKVKTRELLDQLRQSGEDANRFLGLLASQMVALAIVITGSETKINPYQLSQARGLARTMGNQAQQLVKLKELTTKLAQLDVQLKISAPDDVWTKVEICLLNID